MSVSADKLSTYRHLFTWSNPSVGFVNGTPLAILYRFVIVEGGPNGTQLEFAIPFKLAQTLSEALKSNLAVLSDMHDWESVIVRAAAGENIAGHPALDFVMNPIPQIQPHDFVFNDQNIFTSFEIHVFPNEKWVVLVGFLKSNEKLTVKVHPSAAWMMSDEIAMAITRASQGRPGTSSIQ